MQRATASRVFTDSDSAHDGLKNFFFLTLTALSVLSFYDTRLRTFLKHIIEPETIIQLLLLGSTPLKPSKLHPFALI